VDEMAFVNVSVQTKLPSLAVRTSIPRFSITNPTGYRNGAVAWIVAGRMLPVLRFLWVRRAAGSTVRLWGPTEALPERCLFWR
jgi:hypothetical protein